MKSDCVYCEEKTLRTLTWIFVLIAIWMMMTMIATVITNCYCEMVNQGERALIWYKYIMSKCLISSSTIRLLVQQSSRILCFQMLFLRFGYCYLLWTSCSVNVRKYSLDFSFDSKYLIHFSFQTKRDFSLS